MCGSWLTGVGGGDVGSSQPCAVFVMLRNDLTCVAPLFVPAFAGQNSRIGFDIVESLEITASVCATGVAGVPKDSGGACDLRFFRFAAEK